MARPKGTKIYQKRTSLLLTEKMEEEIRDFAKAEDLNENEAIRQLIKKGLNWSKKARPKIWEKTEPSKEHRDDYKLSEEELEELIKIARTKWVANP